MANDLEGVESLIALGVIGVVIYLMYKAGVFANLGNPNLGFSPGIVPSYPGQQIQPGQTSLGYGTGAPSVTKAGTFTINVNGVPTSFGADAPVGPNGQTIQWMLDNCWSYNQIATYLQMSQPGAC